jgi:hypothetical protein
MWAQLQQGQAIPFGKLTISATELTAYGKELAWEDVAAIQVASGGISIRAKGSQGCWYFTPVKNMPNFHVFLALSERLWSAAGKGTV